MDKHRNKNKINIEQADSELFNRFFDNETARQLDDDTRWAQKQFHKTPRAGLEPERLQSIKAAVHNETQNQRTSRLKLTKRIIYAAAVMLIAALLSLMIIDTPDQPDTPQTAAVKKELNNDTALAISDFWHEQSLTDDIAYINSEIENISDNIESVRFGETQQETNLDYIDIEIEFLESNGNFWKG
jgi:hypothetical protein